MKKLLLICLISFSLQASAQSWSAVGSAGNIGREVTGLIDYNGELIISGWFNTSNSTSIGNAIASWNGTSYGTLGSGLTLGWCNDLAVFNGDLYAAGAFSFAGGNFAEGIAKWDGTSWSAVGDGLKGPGFVLVDALAVYGGELYAGGIFDTAGAVITNSIAKWDGTSWTGVGSVTGTGTNYAGGVWGLAEHNGELYMCGAFDTIDGMSVDRVAKWNGSVWSKVGNASIAGTNPLKLASTGSDLYMGGSFDSINSVAVNGIAKWNGTAWSALAGGIDSSKTVSALLGYNNKLYVGGDFITVNGGTTVNYCATWDGSNWSAMDGGFNDGVHAFGVWNFGLYAGGMFTQAGSTSIPYVARWGGIIGMEENAARENSSLYPNPFTTSATINIPVSYGSLGDISVVLYDVTGRAVKTISNPVSYNVTINRDGLASGMYMYSVFNGTEKLTSNKFSVE